MEDLDNKGGRPLRRTLDLSVTQVAASALAAVAGAVLASQLGVYGTILGAAVVSAGATTGTAVFQHVFRRTGEQLREMTTTPVPVEHARPAGPSAAAAEPQVFDPFDPGGERTRMMARINPPEQGEAVAVYRGRSNLKPKSWKVYAVTAAIVFALAMATVGVIELAAGKPASHLFDGGGRSGGPAGGTSAPVDPSPSASSGHSGGTSGTSDTGGAKDVGRTTPDPGSSSGPDPSSSSSPKPDPATATPGPDTSAGGSGNSGIGSSGSGGPGSGAAGSGSGTTSGSAGEAAAPGPAASP